MCVWLQQHPLRRTWPRTGLIFKFGSRQIIIITIMSRRIFSSKYQKNEVWNFYFPEKKGSFSNLYLLFLRN